MNYIEAADREIEILESIYHNQDAIRQRDLAKIVGLSLGMTNAIIKRLAQKGWLKIRKVNNRNIHYIVSPEGIEAITKKSYRYFKRTIKNVVLYKEAIDSLVHKIKSDSFSGIVLLGKSDLDFLLEHSCMKYHIGFNKNKEIDAEDKLFYIYGEGHSSKDMNGEGTVKRNISYLRDIFVNS